MGLLECEVALDADRVAVAVVARRVVGLLRHGVVRDGAQLRARQHVLVLGDAATLLVLGSWLVAHRRDVPHLAAIASVRGFLGGHIAVHRVGHRRVGLRLGGVLLVGHASLVLLHPALSRLVLGERVAQLLLVGESARVLGRRDGSGRSAVGGRAELGGRPGGAGAGSGASAASRMRCSKDSTGGAVAEVPACSWTRRASSARSRSARWRCSACSARMSLVRVLLGDLPLGALRRDLGLVLGPPRRASRRHGPAAAPAWARPPWAPGVPGSGSRSAAVGCGSVGTGSGSGSGPRGSLA